MIYMYIYIYICVCVCVCMRVCVCVYIYIYIYWKVSADLKTSLLFPVHIIQTEKRPDIVAWSDSKKSVLLIELTVPWEENREKAQERKKNRYVTLRADCVEKGWICHVIPIEVGCRGFIGHSVISFLSKIGTTGCSLKVTSNRLQTTARYASSWI